MRLQMRLQNMMVVGGWRCSFDPADLSSSGHCTGISSPSDCPYNIYRTSGDIGTYWDRVLANL